MQPVIQLLFLKLSSSLKVCSLIANDQPTTNQIGPFKA